MTIYKKTIIALIVGILCIVNYGFTSSNKYYIATKPLKLTLTKPDFRAMDNVTEKKELFIKYILKATDEANIEICSERKTIKNLQKIYKTNELSKKQQKLLERYKQFYRINNDNTKTAFKDLLIKVNSLPKSLVVAQAILESGWGTSRFAVDYNNYFGLHCFEENCGIKANGADVYMETFKDAGDSVLGYYHRLNTVESFKELRKAREKYNKTSKPDRKIIEALEDYSALDEGEYQDRLRSVIRQNKLKQYDTPLCH